MMSSDRSTTAAGQLAFLFTHSNVDVVNRRAPTEAARGQGLFSTMW